MDEPLTPDELVADGLLTVEEAGNFLKLGKTEMYALMDAGHLIYSKVGTKKGARRIPKNAVVEYAKNNLVGGWAAG